MTMLHMDGFEHYTTLTEMYQAVNTNGSGSSITVSAGNGRFGASLRRALPNGGTSFVQKTLPSSVSTIVMGQAFKMSTVPGASQGFWLAEIREGTTTHLCIGIDQTGKLGVFRDGITSLGVGSSVLVANVWYYVEIKATIHDSTGSVTVKLNGATEIALTNVDTRNGATGVIDHVYFGGNRQGITYIGTIDQDDFYLCDTAGSTNNDFLGDTRIEAIFPNGNGNSSQLVGSDSNSTDNYLLVDEAAPNSDTDYVESSTVGDKDTYAFGNLASTSGTVFAVEILPYAKKTDAGSRSIKAVARLSGTEVDSAADLALPSSYAYLPDIRETKPGGGAWSISDVNSAEFGVKVTA